MTRDRIRRSDLRLLDVATLFALATLALVGLEPSPAHAQAPRWEVDVAGARIEYDSLAPLNAPSVSGLGEWLRPSLYGRVAASVAGLEGSGWSGQARGDVAGWSAPLGTSSPYRLELAGAASATHQSAGFESAVARGDVRAHARGRAFGGWIGAGASVARSSFDSTSVRAFTPNAGLWVQTSGARATLGLLATRLLGSTYPELNLALSVTEGPVDVSVYGGVRGGPDDASSSGERWAGASAAVWLHSRAAVIVAGGRYGSDLAQGLPGGSFVSIGLRFTTRRSRPIPTSARAPIVYTSEAARGGSIGFVVEGASSVEVAGDWTGWERVPLRRGGDGRWMLPADLGPGVYRFNLRVDGARWMVPPDVAQIDDGYGGKVGLLIISGGS